MLFGMYSVCLIGRKAAWIIEPSCLLQNCTNLRLACHSSWSLYQGRQLAQPLVTFFKTYHPTAIRFKSDCNSSFALLLPPEYGL